MYKAVFLDLDGTLLQADHSISEETRQIIRTLMNRDILVVLVSARPYHGITPIGKWLGSDSMPVVSLNGAYIGLGEDILFESQIDLETLRSLHFQAGDFDASLIYYTGLSWNAEAYNAAIEKEQKITTVPVNIASFESLMHEWKTLQAGANKVMAIGSEPVIAALERKLISIFEGFLNIYPSKPTYLEIMRLDASKSNAVRFLLEKYNIRKEEIMAIGDNFNDKEMIAFAGMGIAMGNAPEAVKAVAQYVTDTNQNDGVRKAIEKFILPSL
jgi:Cof subfamily protein (haloacid dehalogenase superfamily)